MAKAFQPSRSAIYGAPAEQAWLDVGDTVMGQLRDWSDEQIQAEYVQQTSNAEIAMLGAQHDLTKFMRENSRDPGSYVTKFQQDRGKIQQAVMAGVTQPDAKREVEIALNESFARWENWLSESAAKQAGENAAGDFVANYNTLYESVEMKDDSDMRFRLASGLAFLRQGHNKGGLPVHDKVATPEALEFEERKYTRHVLGEYLLQQALASGDEAVLDMGNDLAEGVVGRQGDKPLFGPEELGKLKERYEKATDAAKTEADEQRTARANAFERDATDLMLKKQFNKPDDKGNPINLRDLIINNSDIAPETKRTLTNLYDKQTAEKSVVDPQAAVAMEIINDRVATGQMSLGEGIRMFGKIAGDMSAEQRIKYYTELTGKQSAWRGTLRTKARGIIDDVTNNPPVIRMEFRDKRGRLIVNEKDLSKAQKAEKAAREQQETLYVAENNAAASQAAQLQFYAMIREAEGNDEPLTEEKFLPLAIGIAQQIQRERGKYGSDFIKARYLSPAVGPKEQVRKNVTYSRLTTGEEYVGGQATGKSALPGQGPPETAAGPQTRDEFLSEVARLKSYDIKAARKYYDTWAAQFQNR